MSEQDDNFISFAEDTSSDQEQEELLGQRRESSVLFNLSSLEEANRHLKGDGDAGNAADDASGLINIQHISSLNTLSTPSQAEAISPDPIVIAPAVPQREKGGNVGLYIGIGAALIGLAGVGVAAVVLLKDEGQGQQTIIKEKEIVRTVEDPTTKARLAAAEKARAEAEAKLAARDKESSEEGTPQGDDPKKKGTSRPKSKAGTAPTGADEKGSEETAPPKEKKDGIDDIIGALDKDKEKDKPEADTKAGGNLPKQLSKPQVQSTIKKYNSRILGCGKSSNKDKLGGTVWVKISISPSGKVSSARISSASKKFNGTDLGNCIIGVVRTMKFDAAQEGLDISRYPFLIK